MTAAFELDGQEFTALNGGPTFKFSEALSLVVHCKSQNEMDRYWNHLSPGGDPSAQQCGWLKDKYGVAWQIIPDEMIALISYPNAGESRKVVAALMQMKKIDMDVLRRAGGLSHGT